MRTLLLSIVIATLLAPSLASAKTLFFDDFEDGKISNVFEVTGNNPEFVEEDGVLKQQKQMVGDGCYAVIADQEYPKVLTIKAKMRVDEWETGAYARSGVGVRVSTETGQGLAFLFSDHRVGKPRTGVAFLDDHVAWGPLEAYDWEINKWYWFQLHIDDKDELHAKIWEDGEEEPKNWLWEIANFGVARTEGYPGLNASSGDGGGVSLPSFDQVEVWDKDGSTYVEPVHPAGKLATTWGSIKSKLRL